MFGLILGTLLAGAPDAKAVPMWAAERVSAVALPASEGSQLTPDELDVLKTSRPPFRSFTVGRRLADGTLWIGTKSGLLLRTPGRTDWRLFHSRRWLPDDHVLDLAITTDGAVYVRTSGGVGRLFQAKKSLEQKMTEIHTELRRRHVRHGLVGEIVLKEPGRVDAGSFQPDSDNDGLWTSLYVGAEAFRYAVTGQAEARENAWQSLKALMFLEEVSGISGFPARSIVPSTGAKPTHGEWYRSKDGRWWWKGDTLSDELVGHFFAYSVYWDRAATPAEKELIRPVVARIADHIIDHGYYLVGPPGKPTRWGVWAPERLNQDPNWNLQRCLNSLEVLAYLKVADHICGGTRYRRALADLNDKHAYAMNTVRQKLLWPESQNYSDDELAFLSYYPLLLYERDPRLRKLYRLSLKRSFVIARPEQSPLFNFIYAAGKQADAWTDPARRPTEAGLNPKDYDRDLCADWFRDVPQDLIDWTVKNSGREDLVGPGTNRHRRATSARVLNVAERRLMRWNGDPYQLDGGSDGRSRDDGTFILLPYWMGRYHRFLE